MFARHLPPSAGLPRVLALDARTAAELQPSAAVTLPGEDSGQAAFDAIAGPAAPDGLAHWAARLRPGGRLILAHAGPPEALLAALNAAGLIHCLVEPAGEVCLYRGERPPAGTPLERVQGAAGLLDGASRLVLTAASELKQPYVFLLVAQTPNKPAWKLAPGERVRWQAATLQPPAGAPALLAFSSLLKAVAFMQSAILAGSIAGVNKVGKFPAAAALAWSLPLALNPAFEAARGLPPGPPLEVNPEAAMAGQE